MTMSVSNISLLKRMKYFVQMNWKKIITVFIILIGFLTILGCYSTFCSETSFLDEANSSGSPFWTMDYSGNREGLGSTVITMYKEIYGSGAIQDLSQKLIINVSDSGLQIGNQMISVGNVFTSINEVLIGVGVSIFSIFWICSLLTSFINQQGYAELIIKKLMILAIGVAMIVESNTICQELCNLGSAIITEISSGVTENTTDISGQIDELWNEMNDVNSPVSDLPEDGADDDAGWLDKLFAKLMNLVKAIPTRIGKCLKVNVLNPLKYLLTLLIPWIGVKIAKIVCSVFVYTRAVEIAVLCALSPIPFAILQNDPLGNGTGSRFLKNVAAVSLQGAVMMIVFIVCNSMISGLAGGGVTIDALTEGTFSMLAIYFAEVGLLMKSLSISQKVIGLA